MENTLKQQLTLSARHLLRPLVRLALRHGLSHAEFSQLLRSLFVEVARNDFTPEGKKPSDARVAVITGLSRKDVKHQRELLQSGSAPSTRTANRATRVLSGWLSDPDFSDDNGDTLLLPLHGDISFDTLVNRYSGDIPVGTLLDELLRVSAVATRSDDLLELQKPNYTPASSEPQGLRVLGNATHDLLTTLDHNLNPNRQGTTRLQRTVFSDSLPPQSAGAFRRITREHSQQLIDSLGEWLSANEAIKPTVNDTSTDTSAPLNRCGVGLYYFEYPVDNVLSEPTVQEE